MCRNIVQRHTSRLASPFLMLTLLIKLLTAASLLAHCVLGCCWHHAHGCNDHEAVVAEAEHGHAHVDGRHGSEHKAATHVAGFPACDGEEEHEHGTPCDEPDCSYVKAPQSSVPATVVVSMALMISPCMPSTMAVGRALAAQDAPVSRCSGAALRAQFQVWLV
jgi:hypothetical protein